MLVSCNTNNAAQIPRSLRHYILMAVENPDIHHRYAIRRLMHPS